RCFHHDSIFSFNAPPTTAIYTLSLHDALPILPLVPGRAAPAHETRRPALDGAAGARDGAHCQPQVEPADVREAAAAAHGQGSGLDRKSTRLNSSHLVISYAVFCLKKKKKITTA